MAEGSFSGIIKRVVTAFILIPAIIFVVAYTAPFWVFAVTTAIVALALAEYNNLSTSKTKSRTGDKLLVIAGGVMPAVFFFLGEQYVLPAVVAAVFIFFLYSLWSGLDFPDASYGAAFRTLGLLYVAIPLSYLIFLKALPNGRWWILFIFVVVWANDTFAYLVGKTVGRHKLSPGISPGKTVEGAAGGLLAGCVAAFVYDWFLSLGPGAVETLILSFVIGVVGIAGDLAESVMKRGAGMKDSGSLIPGHGGLLDRLDSLIFPIPLLYYILIYYLQAAR